MKKIKITITMTEQEAEWLEQACFIEEDYPHSKFLNRVSRLARRARHAFQHSVQADELACDDIYHDSLLQWKEVNFCDVCDCGEPFPESGYCKFCGAHERHRP